MKKSGRIGTHAMVYYVTTTTIAVLLGIFLVSFIHPGGTTLELPENNAMKEVSTLDTYLDLVRSVYRLVYFIGHLVCDLFCWLA